jgi:ATP-dependent DNA helicase RecG
MPFDLKIADLGKDGQILNLARSRAAEILADDPELSHRKITSQPQPEEAFRQEVFME